MNSFLRIRQIALGGAIFCALAHGVAWAEGSRDEVQIVEWSGKVEVSASGQMPWHSARSNQVLHATEHLRTGINSRVVLRWSGQSIITFGAATELEILPPHTTGAEPGLQLWRGLLSFFHRGEPGRIQIITRGTIAGVEGTEFLLAVDDADRTTLSVIDGQVRFGNAAATLVLTNGQGAIAAPGQPPRPTPGFIANNLLQWCFYYPAVLDADELALTEDEKKTLAASLTAYRSGDLPDALEKFPNDVNNLSDGVKVYHAAVLLAVGEVAQTETILSTLTEKSGRPEKLANALRQLIAAVKQQASGPLVQPSLASEFLADSYFQQSRAVEKKSLPNALVAAQKAAARSPQNGFAWERVAELEFSFGRTKAATVALDKSLALAPRNAQALALKGFILAAQNAPRRAGGWFDRAIAMNSSLGNAWLGRGLCKIRTGDAQGGQDDLLIAAATEPQRAELRSYLGNALAQAHAHPRAAKELSLAKKLDPDDPTAWFYSALLHQEKNEINEAIGDLEKSAALNHNRSVYRSQFLLDQDRAVRGANLAAMYEDADMEAVGQREAARAVNDDYANYATHEFLANSYVPLAAADGINLRYETLGVIEHTLANLLAPASVSVLSPTLAQSEYSKFFQQNGYGFASRTEYLSRGAWTEWAAHFGTFEKFGYTFETYQHYDRGQRPNNDLSQQAYTLTLKEQLTPEDTISGTINFYQAEGGDLSQRYDNRNYAARYRFGEKQEPDLTLGYHHEWSPGVHTLFNASRLDDTTTFGHGRAPSFVKNYFEDNFGVPYLVAVLPFTAQEIFHSQTTIYSGELQQIWEQAEHTTILGTRWQSGDFNTSVTQWDPYPDRPFFPPDPTPASAQAVSTPFQRTSFYGYHQWQILDQLELMGGLTYDQLRFSENFEIAPVSTRQKTEAQVSPKAGLIWTPAKNSVARFAYTRSLGGASMDQSEQIEPSQVAGFAQTFRSLIPESVVGGTSGGKFETFNLSLEQKFSTRTYLALSGEMLNSTVNRVVGAYFYDADSIDPALAYPIPSGLRENLNFHEKSLGFTCNQLLGNRWSVAASYRISQATLSDVYPEITPNLLGIRFSAQPRQDLEAILQQLGFSAVCNLPNGFFTRGQATWFTQNNFGYTPAEPGDSFIQLNVHIGYRSPHRRAEISLGLLNLTDQDYRVNPLNVANELPRSRTLALRLSLNF